MCLKSSYPLYALQINQTWNGHALAAKEQIQIELEHRPKGLLIDFSAPFYDDPAPAAEPGPTDGLWDYEVLEVFMANGQRYTEVELGPHGHYLVLQLNGYRHCVSKLQEIRYKTYRVASRWMGTALIPWELLPAAPWTYNAYAIHGQGSTRTYLAHFAVKGPEPDFHRLEAFQSLALSQS